MRDFERRGVIHLFPLGSTASLVTEGADEVIVTDRCHVVARSDAALVLDLNLRRLAQAPLVIDLKLGERLGMSRRTAYELVYLGRRFIEL